MYVLYRKQRDEVNSERPLCLWSVAKPELILLWIPLHLNEGYLMLVTFVEEDFTSVCSTIT